MIENKEIPKEYISIRQVWLQQINRCLEAMTNQDMKDDHSHGFAGDSAVVDGIRGLYYTLVDYGEAKVKSDVDYKFKRWKKEQFELRKDEKILVSDVEKQRFQIIIQVLNKYGMLFESQPSGFSNVEIKSV